MEEPSEVIPPVDRPRNPLWDRLAREASIELSDAQHALLHRYLDLLIETNKSLNLTRIVDRANAEVKHAGDALTVLRFLPAEADKPATVADVGTGGGVPGIPIAIARPDLRVTLIDSTKKKLDAVMRMVDELRVKNVTSIHSRIEGVTKKFDVIVARAVADLTTLIEWCAPLMHSKSVMLAMKGPKAVDEMNAAKRTMTRLRLRGEIVEIGIPELPGHVIARITRSK